VIAEDSSGLAPDFHYPDAEASKKLWFQRTDFADRHGSFLPWHGQW